MVKLLCRLDNDKVDGTLRANSLIEQQSDICIEVYVAGLLEVLVFESLA